MILWCFRGEEPEHGRSFPRRRQPSSPLFLLLRAQCSLQALSDSGRFSQPSFANCNIQYYLLLNHKHIIRLLSLRTTQNYLECDPSIYCHSTATWLLATKILNSNLAASLAIIPSDPSCFCSKVCSKGRTPKDRKQLSSLHQSTFTQASSILLQGSKQRRHTQEKRVNNQS